MPRIIADGQPAGAGGGVATGDVSLAAVFTEDISGVTAPVDGTLGATAVATLDHDGSGTTTGQQIQFTVPDDYDSGDLALKITYAMSTAVSADIVVSTKAEIVDVTNNTIDTASYPETNQIVTPPTTASTPRREEFLTIAAADFGPGDTILFQIKRKSGDASDTHTGLWQVISYEIAYTGQVATREVTQHIVAFNDTDETPASSGTWGDFGTADFSGSADNEQAISFIVPENYDGFSDLHIVLNYLMGGTAGGNVVLETEGTVVDISGATTAAIASAKFTFAAPTNTNPRRTTAIRALAATSIGPGDTIALKIARRASTDTNDTATDSFRVIDALAVTGVAPKTGFSQVVVEEHYLEAHDFTVVTGTPTGDQLSPKLTQTFETWARALGTAASQQINVSFQGRLMSTQSTIDSIKVPIMALQYLTHGALTGSWVEGETVTGSVSGTCKIWEVIDATHFWAYDVSGTLSGTLTGASGSAAFTSIVNKGQYVLKVYSEGDGSPPAYTSGAAADAPTSRTVLSLASGDISPQPTGEGRFFVVVECSVDQNETVLVGRPFVGQE